MLGTENYGCRVYSSFTGTLKIFRHITVYWRAGNLLRCTLMMLHYANHTELDIYYCVLLQDTYYRIRWLYHSLLIYTGAYKFIQLQYCLRTIFIGNEFSVLLRIFKWNDFKSNYGRKDILYLSVYWQKLSKGNFEESHAFPNWTKF